MSLESVIRTVKEKDNFLITAHTSPEGDAIGAQIGFLRLVNKLGKKAVALNQDALPYGLDFLPDAARIQKLGPKSSRIDFDCMVVLDCSELSRAGKVAALRRSSSALINIDHHISNDNFGDQSWVEPSASSCSEMIFRLYKEMGVALDRQAALALYVGILTDTGSFRYSNTSGLTHQAVSELLQFDIDVPQVYRYCYEDIPFKDMKLLAGALGGIRREASGRIIWCELRRKFLKKDIRSFDLGENVLSFCRSVKGVEVAVLFRERFGSKGEIRVNLRSRGKVDVNKIASHFNGGGHRTASGATVKGALASVRRQVLAKIRSSLR